MNRAHRSIFPNQGFLSQLCDFEYELKRSGSLVDIKRQVSPELEEPLPDQTLAPAFHPDHRPMYSSTNYWPLTRPVTRSGYPISGGYWDYETESRSRARTVDRYPSSYDRARSVSPGVYRTIRSQTVVPDAVYYPDRHARSSSAGPSSKAIETRSTSSVISSYDVTKPYYRNYLYIRTTPDSFYYTPRYYDSSYYSPRYYSRYDYYPYLSPYFSRYYYSRYYSPSTDSYYYYNRYPYLSSYLPLSLRYPSLYSRYYY
ncbi:BEN domain-containing protein 5 [Armadillidium vulgare]|nr:BEN domain-containing protein 5 [Armadillidium vulgare]